MDKLFIIAQMEQAHTDAVVSGVKLARLLNMQAQVFAYVYEYFSDGEGDNAHLIDVAQKQLISQKEAYFQQKLAALDADDISLHMIWGKYLCEHACHYSADHDFKMIVKAVHHADHYLPTDWQLIRHTKMPLLLLTDNPLHRSDVTLMAVDLGSNNQVKQQLNEAVISQSKRFAEASGTKLHLAFVVRFPKVLRDLDIIDDRQLVKQAYKDHQEQIAKLNLAPECVHIIAGDPELCLYELACRLNSKYLVIGARQRQGLLGRIIGNTAESILGRMRSNVLVIPAS